MEAPLQAQAKSFMVRCRWWSTKNHATYQGLPSPLAIARYHLVATHVSDSLTATAEVDGLVMSVVQEQDKACGFQFHPESIMTTYGAALLANAIEWAFEKNDTLDKKRAN